MQLPTIVISGGTGQLGSEASRYFQSCGWHVLSLDHHTLDITDAAATVAHLTKYKPRYLLNTAAYTNVDGAEDDTLRCNDINTTAVKHLVDTCNLLSITFIHISTDYVFDGTSETSYSEDSPLTPINAYGMSKARADHYIQHNSNDFLILRASWIYRYTGKNFLTTMISLAQRKDALSVVNDQWGAPTSTIQIVEVLHQLLGKECRGLYNCVAQGSTTWFGFAQEIFTQMGITIQLSPCTSEEYPTSAQRPKHSLLALSKLSAQSIVTAPWKSALTNEISKLKDIK